MNNQKISEIVSKLTLEEKAGLCSGQDDWTTKTVERLGIPKIKVSDGPHGLRVVKDNTVSNGAAEEAVCFPAACLCAASFDRDLIKQMGETLGQEAKAMEVDILLGPGINITRNPLCGRNFEYFSEDPYLAGELGSAYVQGVQSQGVGTSLKHFFANNQEYRRKDCSSELDERTMREIYLPAFETVVKRAKPWTIMASYNKINGTYSTENYKYLTELLREEWGFAGAVISDWGATHDRVRAVAAGTELTMPGEPATDRKIVEAVKSGDLEESLLDQACIRLLGIIFKAQENLVDDCDKNELDLESDHYMARKIAAESIVLLKNDNDVLPLTKTEKIAMIGAFARAPRYQGGGSSHINSSKISSCYEAAQLISSNSISYAPGYIAGSGDIDNGLINEAVQIARQADKAIIFVGLTDEIESEGFDRKNMKLPASHNALVEAVAAVQENTIVVLHNGSPVELSWADKVTAIVEAYLGGQAIGEAVTDVLYGSANPSGRLPETFPLRLEDNPSYLFFPGERGLAEYSERMFVGYRYYVSKKMSVRFPFGHGLSYTNFDYSNLKVEKNDSVNDELIVTVSVRNSGDRSGKEVVQLYISPVKAQSIRPLRELKRFDKISLDPGEIKSVRFKLSLRDFACWNPDHSEWITETGEYKIQLGASSEKILIEQVVKVDGNDKNLKITYTPSTLIRHFYAHPVGRKVLINGYPSLMRGFAQMSMMTENKDESSQKLIEEQDPKVIADLLDQAVADDQSAFSTFMDQGVSLLSMFIPELNGDRLNDILDRMNSGG
jgi:beta-glucosidase